MTDDRLVREAKLDFAQRAAGRYRDHIAEVLQTAISNEHIEASTAVALLLELAAMIAAAALGPDDGARYLEERTRELADAMRAPRPTVN